MSETNFTKLFSSITDSTIWCEDSDTRVVWITMLAMADENGWVYASVPGLVNRAQVKRNAVEDALNTFLSPDPDSRTPDNEGRRIEKIEGGLAILNHPKYRKIRNKEERKAYQRDWMRNKRANVDTPVDKCGQSRPACTKAEAEAEADKKKKTSRFAPPSLEEVKNYIQEKHYSIKAESFFAHYESNGWKVGKNPMKDWKAAVRSWQSRETPTHVERSRVQYNADGTERLQ